MKVDREPCESAEKAISLPITERNVDRYYGSRLRHQGRRLDSMYTKYKHCKCAPGTRHCLSIAYRWSGSRIHTFLVQCLVTCLNWNDVNHLTAESCVVVLDFNVGVGSKEAKAGRSGILVSRSANDAGDGNSKDTQLHVCPITNNNHDYL